MSAWTFDRKLNLLEHPYADMAEAGAMNAVFILRIGAVIPPAALRAGLDAVQRCFDGATVRLVRRDGAWFFSTEGVPPVPMRVVMRESESDWIAAAERELNLPFPELGPFFRLTVLQPNAESAPRMTELILTAHHVVGDLNTAFRVCEVLLSECQRIQDGRPPIDISRVDLPEISASMLPPEAQGQFMERRVRFAKAQYGHLAPVEKPLPLGRTRIEYRELPGG